MSEPRTVLITGASSGIGAALARAYAAPGTRLALTGRDRGRLDAVAGLCTRAGAAVTSAVLDVTDAPALARWIETVDADRPLELVIANAGVSAGTAGAETDQAATHRILAVNVHGVTNTVLPAIAVMRRRRAGQIAIVSSLAAFRGLPSAPAYCASKAAVRVWGEALRSELWAEGIAVSVICPGYVRTPMTERHSAWTPMMMEADAAATLIRRRLRRRPARIVFPWPLYAALRLFAGLPPALTDPLLRRLADKI